MTEFYKYYTKDFEGNDNKITIASGPVVINEEGKFLLHVSQNTGKYQFIGGRLDDKKSVIENAIFRSF